MAPLVWRPPTQTFFSDVDPIQPGGESGGWVSGSLRGALGGARAGAGMAAGAVTIVNGVVTAIGAPTSGGTGYPASARFEVVINGDGVGARAWAGTNSSGAVTSFTVVAGGSGYTAATVSVREASLISVLFDAGPSWHQYPIAICGAADIGGSVGLMELHGSNDVGDGYFMLLSLSGTNEAYFAGMEYANNPIRAVRLGARYLKIRYRPAVTIAPTARVSLTLQAA